MKLAALVVAAALIAPAARADEIACWLDGGVLVAPAVVAGIPGDYIIDTATPHTLLHNTRAQSAGIASSTLVARARLAGRQVDEVAVTVVDLDARTAALPTPIAGVIGTDVLGGFVLDLHLSPCRLGLRAGRGRTHGDAPATPLVHASLSDGQARADGLLEIATGAAEPLHLSDASAELVAAGSSPAGEPPVPHGRLAELSVAGRRLRDVRAAIVPQADLDPRAMGVLAATALGADDLSFDFARQRLRITPAR